MNIKELYKDYCNSIDAYTPEEFESALYNVPGACLKEEISFDDYSSLDTIEEYIIQETILNNYNYVYIEKIQTEFKSLSLGDVDSIDDLNEIAQKLSPWIISNYNELCDELNYSNNSYDLIDTLIDRRKITITDIKNYINDYEKKRSRESE